MKALYELSEEAARLSAQGRTPPIRAILIAYLTAKAAPYWTAAQRIF